MGEIPPIFDKTKAKYIDVNKDTQFEKGDFVTFVFINPEAQMEDINKNSKVALVNRVEGRYIGLSFSEEPLKNGEVAFMHLNQSMTVRMNGYSTVSSIGMDGVIVWELPLADVVNMQASIVIKSMMERNK
jgi:hypothetical protein